ncbi:uncharacterized protein TNCV_1557611 [Trichonephila clavipes]|nr:uncharacterized protein TNCV_1557611 [Trichonephila clavipes]
MRGLAARRLFKVLPCHKSTILLQTSLSSPGFEPSPYGTAVSVANHYTGWATMTVYQKVKVKTQFLRRKYSVYPESPAQLISRKSEKAAKSEQEKFKLESEKARIEFEKTKLEHGQIRSENSNLIFQNTVFGFVASGSNSFADTEARVHCGLIKGDLNQTLKMFWESENVEVERTKNKEAIFCEDHFLKTHSRDDEGRYVVKMPLKNEPNCLGESRDIALKRLNALWTRLIRDPQYLKLYRDFIHEYE